MVRLLTQARLQNYIGHEFGSWHWWMLVILLTVPWAIWYKLADKKKIVLVMARWLARIFREKELITVLFWYIRSVVDLTIWLIFADKKMWRELLPVCFLGSLLGETSDSITHHYLLWEYDYNTSVLPELLNNWVLYIVVIWLFIQWLPTKRTLGRMFGYWFMWTAVALAIERIHLKTGHIIYYQWWNMYCSYIVDWVLFSIFYLYYKLFHFEK